MKITAHCVVKNEDLWIWFAIQSVLPLVEKILIYDTGSTDKTKKVIETIGSSKIIFEEKGEVNKNELVRLRQEQLDRTKTDWFLILDGDEIWPEKQLSKLLEAAQGSPIKTVAVFNHVRNCIGDIYHYLPEEAGNYQIAGIRGNLNTRLIKKTANLRIRGEYPLEVYEDENGPIQSQDKAIMHSESWYLHTSFLKRSSTVKSKVSGSFGKSKLWQKGLKFKESELPEVLKMDRPKIVPNPYKKRTIIYETAATILDPAFKLKRRINRF